MISLTASRVEANQLNWVNECAPDFWLLNHADHIEEETDVQELVNLIIDLRNYLVSQNCEIVDLNAFLDTSRDYLSNQGFFIDDAVFDGLKREIWALQNSNAYSKIRNHKKDKKKKDKELRINSKTAVGFLKFVAGGLLCLVPLPVVQGAGVGLAVLGVSEMADGAREQADQREKDQENQRINRQLEFNH